MRRILIDDSIRAIAEKYKIQLDKGKGKYNSPRKNLNTLKNDLRLDAKQKKYVELIIDKWEKLILLEPPFDRTISEFEKIYSADEVSQVEINCGSPKDGIKFYKKVVDAMRYDYVQETIYKDIVKKLGIRTCVYCNAQYAFSYSLGNDDFINYEIEHWMPKSKYPYLCTSFFNLQPSCPKCNKMKSNKDDILPFCLFTHNVEDLNPFEFSVDKGSCALFLATNDKEKLRISFKAKDEQLGENMNILFHITTQYQAHKDIVEELIWKQKIYNQTILDIYRDSFKSLGFRKSDFNRFILSNYDMEEDILKRPLSKMMQDIAKQLGIVK